MELRVSFLSVVLAAFLVTGPACIVPVRVNNKTRDASGGTPQQLDIGFLRAGSTTREDVARNLAGISVGGNRNFFWGRWEHSKWAVFGFGLSGGGGGRAWSVSNLVIQFDQTGLVKSWEIVGDKDLDSKLDQADSGATDLLDLSFPVQAIARVCCWVGSPESTLVLRSDVFQYAYPRNEDACEFDIPRTNVQSFRLRPAFGNDYWPSLLATAYFVKPVLCQCVHDRHIRSFKQKHLEMILDPKTFLLFRSYIRQAGNERTMMDLRTRTGARAHIKR